MDAELLFGSPAGGFPLPEVLLSVLPRRTSPCVLRLGFPFVSRAGADTFLSGLGESAAWHTARKSWLVGVSQGVTEPAALEQLAALSGSRVRLFSPTGEMSEKALRGRPLFHAKVISVGHTQRGPEYLDALVVSSANLTRAAIGDSGANYEAGVSVSEPTAAMRRRWRQWWQSAWACGIPLSKTTLSKYVLVRERFLQENPVVLEGVDPPSQEGIKAAFTLWIHAGAMSGGSRNQVEFPRELAAFFGPVSSKQRLIGIRAGRQRWDDRPLSPKVTTFGVEIWRLSLPTTASSSLHYPGRVIRFRRALDGGSDFLLDVADADSRAAHGWHAEANRRGYVGLTSGKRSFGFV